MEKGQVKKLVLIGGSAGSIEVLMAVLPRLPIGMDFPIVVVLHRKSSDDNTLEELFAMKTHVPVREIEDKTRIENGSLYVVPADYHLLFESNGTVSLDVSEKVHYSRPSIDVVFESAAATYKEGVVAILLSGSNADGALGCVRVQENGGTVVVQNPAEAEMPFMPNSAIQLLKPDFIASTDDIASLIGRI
ncbi:chemotaxis protein CheB [Flavobacterium selenitireducens]|uniref:chemotaxis protein CheB n=1 Tax=Flavobacterium selenitireducens TaxID=2722704 RepID=UPI00168B63EF|nr:chemotaxis protein CheB [Flavobacterium selenitireducens]MBD3583043.1 chemotaxis protein CheB [Flavobacterium selenitireducens]